MGTIQQAVENDTALPKSVLDTFEVDDTIICPYRLIYPDAKGKYLAERKINHLKMHHSILKGLV